MSAPRPVKSYQRGLDSEETWPCVFFETRQKFSFKTRLTKCAHRDYSCTTECSTLNRTEGTPWPHSERSSSNTLALALKWHSVILLKAALIIYSFSPSHPCSVNSSLTTLQHWQSGRGSCLKKGVVTPGEMCVHIFSTFQRWGSVCIWTCLSKKDAH